MDKRLLIIAGPSAGGKTTVAEELIAKDPRFSLVRSVTTRQPRGDGRDGEYFYLTREEFLAELSRGQILESMEYSSELYGTPRSELERILSEGRIPLLILDLNGVVSLTDNPEYSSCAVYVYVDLNTAESRLYSRYLGDNPTAKGLASFVSRKEQNIRDFMKLPSLDSRFYAFVENSGELSTAVDLVADTFARFTKGHPADCDAISSIADSLALSASAKSDHKA